MTRVNLWNLLLSLTTIVGFGLAIWQTLRAEQLNRRERARRSSTSPRVWPRSSTAGSCCSTTM